MDPDPPSHGLLVVTAFVVPVPILIGMVDVTAGAYSAVTAVPAAGLVTGVLATRSLMRRREGNGVAVLALVLSVVNVGWLMVGLALFALSARH